MLFWWFVLAVFWFVVDDEGFLDYVQVLHQFSFVALNQQTASRINLEINAFAMPLSVLNDLAEAMKALDGKKKPPLSYQQTVALLGLWERRATMGSQCRALTQAAELTFGLPAVFRTPEDWQAEIKGEVFDLVQCAQRIYTGAAPRTSQVLIDRPQKWAQWVFSVGSVWQEDSPMPDRPLTVHCSGLGGGLLSPEHEYDIFFQNHAQMKVYGPSLAMTDDWEQRITQLGLTKTTHEWVGGWGPQYHAHNRGRWTREGPGGR